MTRARLLLRCMSVACLAGCWFAGAVPLRAQGMLDPEGLAKLGVELDAAVAVAEGIEAEVWAEAAEEVADE